MTIKSQRQSKTIKLLTKGFQRSVYWNEYKTKSEMKNRTNEYRYILKSNLIGIKRLFVLVYLNWNINVKISKILFTKRDYQEL